MLAHVGFVESLKAGVAQRRCAVVVVSINGMVNVLEAVVQLLRVPEIDGNHGGWHRIAAAKNDASYGIHLILGVGFKHINEQSEQLEPLLLR